MPTDEDLPPPVPGQELNPQKDLGDLGNTSEDRTEHHPHVDEAAEILPPLQENYTNRKWETSGKPVTSEMFGSNPEGVSKRRFPLYRYTIFGLVGLIAIASAAITHKLYQKYVSTPEPVIASEMAAVPFAENDFWESMTLSDRNCFTPIREEVKDQQPQLVLEREVQRLSNFVAPYLKVADLNSEDRYAWNRILEATLPPADCSTLAPPSAEDRYAWNRVLEATLPPADCSTLAPPSAEDRYAWNRVLEATLPPADCSTPAPQDWYTRFTGPGAFNKGAFLTLFQEYIRERGASQFWKDVEGHEYFDIIAKGNESDPRFCTNVRLFEERFYQWVGDTPERAKACIFKQKCK